MDAFVLDLRRAPSTDPKTLATMERWLLWCEGHGVRVRLHAAAGSLLGARLCQMAYEGSPNLDFELAAEDSRTPEPRFEVAAIA